ncbi:MAG: ATP-grasp domain-containing protein [Streptococcaceae bacterium]|jgi:biotin carboxylase|nr:ATP-grasp domain-containing protein [Streptococcaceae bacterium]
MKNFVLVSPHFPTNFLPFAARLKEKGVNTLGLGDEPYDLLPNELKENLTEYYQVSNLENYHEAHRAVQYFAEKYGEIHRIESHNEHWLELDAKLRTDFDVFGYKVNDLESIKFKSGMKKVYQSIGLKVAKGRVITTDSDARSLANEFNYQVIIKPDNGVGAGDTHKIMSENDLEAFLQHRIPEVSYIMEEFIEGDIVTFDGLTDVDGKIVFHSSMNYNTAVINTVITGNDLFFYVTKDIPEALSQMGEKIVQAFNTKERFFHLEFFLTPSGEYIPLEVNMRLPGGSSIDMMNYANDIDLFAEYANLVSTGAFQNTASRQYYCAYVARNYENNHYHHNDNEIRDHLGENLKEILSIPGIFATLMGNVGYIVRAETTESLKEAIEFIQGKY